MPVIDDAEYFRKWEWSFPGQFLQRDPDGSLTVDVVKLIDHAPALSTGEQIYAAVWFECYARRPAPWLDAEASPLALLGVLDLDMRADAVAHIARTYVHPQR